MIFLRYLREVADATGELLNYADKDRDGLYERLLGVAKKKTTEADTRFDDRGRKVEVSQEETFGEHTLVVAQDPPPTV